MRIAKKLTGMIAGVSTLALVGAAVPVSAHSATSASTSITKSQVKRNVMALETQSNAAVTVDTEVDCTSHTLSAKVTNKTTGNITPDVTFNAQAPMFPSTTPIEAG